MEIWRLTLWLARCQAFRQAADAYLRSGAPAMCKASWFIANTLLRRGPLLADPNIRWSKFE